MVIVTMDRTKGRATMVTLITSAIFIRNFIIYNRFNVEDVRFTHEAMFVMCDPQCHPPKTVEQVEKWMEINPT